ncbi:MAG: hypothetical protein K9L29_08905, partial [Spirochaetales bacterium]|nr:hypothetical protein [Spirochaetales bacterium]
MKSSIRVGKRAFFAAFFIILGLMILSGVLTRLVPAGNYEREIVDGRERVVPGSYQEVEKPDYPVWRWFTAPAEVPFSEAGLTIGTIIVFLIFVGGSFTILEEGGILRRMMEIIVRRFINRKYLLMAIVMFFFMFVASVLGIYEGMVPLVIFVVPLALSLGWDSMTGLGMSLLPLSFGFAAAITNPFTIGVAQSIAELPLFSGAWLRIIFFIVIYCLLLLFVRRYARKVESDPSRSPVYQEDLVIREEGAETVEISETEDVSRMPVKPVGSGMRKAIIWFGGAMLLAIIFILVTGRIASLSRYAFPAMSVLFFIGGIGAGLFAGMGVGRVFSTFGRGGLRILPAVLIILMAYSVKLIIDNGGITDTILYQAG